MGRQRKSEFFFSFSRFFQKSFFCSLSLHFFFFDKKEDKEEEERETKREDDFFNLEGLTVYFPYEYLYPVRFKRVDFFTIAILLPFSSSRSLSFFPSAHDSDDDANDDDDDHHHHHHHHRH